MASPAFDGFDIPPTFEKPTSDCVFQKPGFLIAPSFHLPKSMDKPLILVGPGTGIAPFRGFWHHRKALIEEVKENNPEEPEATVGDVWLFFGCRNTALDLYKNEKEQMVTERVLDRVFLALSRDPTIPKTYVQDLILKEKRAIYRKLIEEKGHFYVCGDCTMAEHVYQTLKSIFKELGGKSEQEVENYMLKMRDENRYHEDIFGITLRTAEVHSRSRESARMRLESRSST